MLACDRPFTALFCCKGAFRRITYFNFTQFAVYNGVTYDPQNLSVVN